MLALMKFTPVVSPDLKLMDGRLFRPEPIGLKAMLEERTRRKVIWGADAPQDLSIMNLS